MSPVEGTEGAGRVAERAGGAPAPAGPYVSIQEHNNPTGGSSVSSSRSKSVYRWRVDMEAFVEKWGIDNIGFVTLGFADPQPTADEAETRFNSAMTNFLRREFLAYIAVLERGGQNGKLHFHLLAALSYPIRHGFNFDALKLKRVRGTNARPELLALWKRLRRKMPDYGFGGFPQVIPIRKNATAAAVYLAGYMTKTLKCRHVDDVGRRLIRTSRNVVRHTTGQFTWNSVGGWIYREKLRLFAFKQGYYSIEQLHFQLGHDVAHKYREEISGQVIPSFPSRRPYERLHGPICDERGMRVVGEYSVEVDCGNHLIRPVGPFLPYHLRNPQLPRYHPIPVDENPF